VNLRKLRIGRAAARVLVGCIAAFALALSLSVPAGATDAFPATDDHSTQTATAWWWYFGQSASSVGALVNQNHARLTQVRVEDPSVPTFAVTMVANSGDYASGWWWYFGQSASSVGALLTQNNARLISLDPYQTSAGLRFAVVMVPNTGAQGRAWWWYFGQSASSVGALLTQNNARLTALRPYTDNGQRLFAVIMVDNTGVASKNWQWWINQSPSDVTSHTNDVNNPMRMTELAPDPLGGFDVVLEAAEGEPWYWYFGVSPATIGSNVSSHGTRLIDLSSYVVNGTRQYTEVELGNTNPGQAPVNAESSRVQALADASGWAGGYHGAYFVSSVPGSTPVVAVNSNFRYEPASSIKVLYLLYTLRQGVPMNAPLTYYWTDSNPPNPNACPADVPETAANAHTTTFGTALAAMMQQSNNVYTRAFAIHWGLPAVQAMAASLGMPSTHLNQPFIGCGFRGVAGGVRNELTLADAARLYAAVSNGTALPAPARATFFNTLLGGPASASDPWGQVVTQEAAAQGKSAIVSQFLAQLNVRSKGGSYGICLATCNPYKDDLSLTGWVSIPFKSGGVVLPRTYEFGDFVNDLILTCSNCTASNNALNNLSGTAAEAARSTIRQALATW
jgi:hypothetical protein